MTAHYHAARGRVSTCAEFNFYNDPEAAQVVLKEFINITILPYEVCRRFLLSWVRITTVYPQSFLMMILFDCNFVSFIDFVCVCFCFWRQRQCIVCCECCCIYCLLWLVFHVSSVMNAVSYVLCYEFCLMRYWIMCAVSCILCYECCFLCYLFWTLFYVLFGLNDVSWIV